MAPHRSATIPAAINFSSSGDNIVISAPAYGPINVYGLFFTVNGATNFYFKDSVVGQLSGTIVLTGNGSSQTLPLQDEPYYFTQPGSNFVINSSNAVTFGGTIWYTNG
jgi:hypothetical protein